MSDELTSWRQLTPIERAIVSNGCGAKGGKFTPPAFRFTASCNQHDFYYWRGHTEDDRRKADRAFLRAMRRDAALLPWYKRPIAHIAAWVYYRSVRIFGRPFFYYGDRYRQRSEIR